jgi:DNA-binding response OmpR family regulator
LHFERDFGGLQFAFSLVSSSARLEFYNQTMQRVLVVDDDASVRSFLKRGLSFEGFSVEAAESGEQGLKAALERLPHLIILDLMMPGIDGFEVLRRLRAAEVQIPVVMLTANDANEAQLEGLNAGADDYVIKPVNFDVLMARIRAIQRRAGAATSSVLRFDDLYMDTGAFVVRRGNRLLSLTSREFKLLQEFLEQPERVMSKNYLLDRVWGADFFGDDNIVEVFISQLRQKLEEKTEPRLIHTIRNVGYVLRTA